MEDGIVTHLSFRYPDPTSGNKSLMTFVYELNVELGIFRTVEALIYATSSVMFSAQLTCIIIIV
jgi:hypothetical protein